MWDWAACSWPICSPAGSTATQRFCYLGRQPMNPKTTEHHRSKPAYVYVRQSTLAQVRDHHESTERQYALREKAQELGWSEPAIRILDRDLGRSGAQTRADSTWRDRDKRAPPTPLRDCIAARRPLPERR